MRHLFLGHENPTKDINLWLLLATHAESVSPVLDEDIADAAVAGEKLLNVPLTHGKRQITHEDAVSVAGRHDEDADGSG